MKFQPKKESELSTFELMPEGKYPFEIIEGTDTKSKAGNDMIALKLKVFKNDGSFAIVFDYLLEAMMYKVKHASDACGLSDKYENGKLEGADFVGKTGYVKIKIKPAQGDYAAANVVQDYVVEKDNAGTGVVLPKKPEKVTIEEDSIPF